MTHRLDRLPNSLKGPMRGQMLFIDEDHNLLSIMARGGEAAKSRERCPCGLFPLWTLVILQCLSTIGMVQGRLLLIELMGMLSKC